MSAMSNVGDGRVPAVPLTDREAMAQALAHPVRHFLPEQLRAPAWLFYGHFSYLYGLTELSVALWCREWLAANPELEAGDLVAAFGRMARPERMARFERVPHLVAALAADIEETLRRRRNARELAEVRRQAGARATAAEMTAFQDMLNRQFGADPELAAGPPGDEVAG